MFVCVCANLCVCVSVCVSVCSSPLILIKFLNNCFLNADICMAWAYPRGASCYMSERSNGIFNVKGERKGLGTFQDNGRERIQGVFQVRGVGRVWYSLGGYIQNYYRASGCCM